MTDVGLTRSGVLPCRINLYYTFLRLELFFAFNTAEVELSLDNDGYLLTFETSISKYRDTGFMVYNLRINTHIHRVSLRALL